MDRASLLRDARRIVVKVGTSVLADRELTLPPQFFETLAGQIDALRRGGIEVIVVSSGAIAAGRAALGLGRPATLAEKQAAAAVGQIRLVEHYRDALAPHGHPLGQVLLTHGDFQNRQRFLNARQTLLKLLQLGVVPLINENDAVSVEEILVGDNDNLSALVAALVDADLLVLLSDVDGLYTANPDDDPGARRVPWIEDVEAVLPYARDTANPGSTGGMRTKLQAAKRAAAYGIATLILHGDDFARWDALTAGADLGTVFAPAPRLRGRKHWIVHTLKAKGVVHVDAGARAALLAGGKSLLPAGVVRVEGRFEPGDPVDVAGPDGRPFARGLASYGASDAAKLCGLRSAEIEAVLAYKTHEETIHRNHPALF